jgi:hypothetical protein
MGNYQDINFALVEEVRPPIYTAMKYWGKKPHNIWRKYIETYTPKDGVFLDPFAGSAISGFEAVKAQRSAIIFDLNPLTSFIVETYSTRFEPEKFKTAVNNIVSSFDDDEVYQDFFSTTSRETNVQTIVQHFKWKGDKLYELGVMRTESELKKLKEVKKGRVSDKYIAHPIKKDNEKNNRLNNIAIPYWYPSKEFHKSTSFTENFIECIGGNNFSNIWTKRNLYVNAKIFDQILQIKDDDLKRQLLFGFIQSIHLSSKMCVPRRKAANRPFSTSWGRSAYICANRKMEMNALFVFKSSCVGKQSVESCLSNIPNYLGKLPKIVEVSHGHKNKNKAFDLKYGVVDINVLTDYVDEESVDFIMTDPPYGGLVQYFDLSSIWLNWLKKYDDKYRLNYDAEITIKPGIIDLDLYQQRFTNAIKVLYKVLKPKAKIVFTFHNKNIQVWNAFLNSIILAGFKIEKVIHQQNRRTGESNVANPYGTSGTDFYIRCVKAPFIKLKTDRDQFKHFVLTKAIEIISKRNEPTPYQMLFNGLLTEISSAGFDVGNFDANLNKILESEIGKVFVLTSNIENQAGNYWWFTEPKKFIKYPDRMLSDRVESSIISLLRRDISVDFNDVVADIFVRYPNGLTPDMKSINTVLSKYAVKSSGKWLYNAIEVERNFTKHTEVLYQLMKIGKKINYQVYIGKREQPEKINNKILRDYVDMKSLSHLELNREVLKRIEMIDMVWCNKNGEIEYVIEVENSTTFTSGIQRASNLHKDVPKIMVMPNTREREFKRIRDPLFVDSFKEHNWSYIFYSDIDRLFKKNRIEIEELKKLTHTL